MCKQIGPIIYFCSGNEAFKIGNCFPGAREDNSHYDIFQAVAAQRSMRKFRFVDRFWRLPQPFLPLSPNAAGEIRQGNSQFD